MTTVMNNNKITKFHWFVLDEEMLHRKMRKETQGEDLKRHVFHMSDNWTLSCQSFVTKQMQTCRYFQLTFILHRVTNWYA